MNLDRVPLKVFLTRRKCFSARRVNERLFEFALKVVEDVLKRYPLAKELSRGPALSVTLQECGGLIHVDIHAAKGVVSGIPQGKQLIRISMEERDKKRTVALAIRVPRSCKTFKQGDGRWKIVVPHRVAFPADQLLLDDDGDKMAMKKISPSDDLEETLDRYLSYISAKYIRDALAEKDPDAYPTSSEDEKPIRNENHGSDTLFLEVPYLEEELVNLEVIPDSEREPAKLEVIPDSEDEPL